MPDALNEQSMPRLTALMAWQESEKQQKEKGASRFSRERNYYEFVRIHGFHPLFGEWQPQLCEQDLRDNRDPQAIGRKILGKANPLRAADRYATLS